MHYEFMKLVTYKATISWNITILGQAFNKYWQCTNAQHGCT